MSHITTWSDVDICLDKTNYGETYPGKTPGEDGASYFPAKRGTELPTKDNRQQIRV